MSTKARVGRTTVSRVSNFPVSTAHGTPAAERKNNLGQMMGAKGSHTRRRLLDAVGTLLRDVPLRDLRVPQVARLARTSSATFYVYFRDVPEAVLALVKEVSTGLPAALEPIAALPPEAWSYESARSFVQRFVGFWAPNLALFRVRNLVSDEGDPRFRQVRVETVASTMDQLSRRIGAAGAIPPNLHPTSVAGALLAMIERVSGIQANSSLAGILPAICDAAAFFLGLVTTPRGGRPADSTGRVAFSAEDTGTLPAIGSVGLKMLGQAPESSKPASCGRGEKTKTRIIEAVGSFFRTHGVCEIKVTDIARHLGISNATFYLYFESVHDAALALLAERTQSAPRLLDLLNAPWDANAREVNAQLFVHDFVEQWLADAALYRVRDLAADEGDIRFIRAKDNSLSVLRLALAERVAHCQARGGLPTDLQPLAVSAAFLEMLERLAITPNFNEEVTLATAGRAAAYFLTTIICGVSIPAPSDSVRV